MTIFMAECIFLAKRRNSVLWEIRRYIRKTLTFYCKICTFAIYNSGVSFQKHDIYFDGVCAKRATEKRRKQMMVIRGKETP